MVRTHIQPGDPMTPPPHPGVGDSWLWYLWYFAQGNPYYKKLSCTVRGMGQTCYVMVEDSQWGTRVQQSDVDAIVAAWDNHSYGQWPNEGIYQLDTENFGPAPDMLDHDPRIYIMLYDFDITGADGFFWFYDEYPDGWDQQYRSNECEVIYVDASTPDPGGPGGPYLTAVMAHEFQHMIHWLADPNEETWLNEGMSELAMWFYGHPDKITGFNSLPDNGLTSWGGNYPDYVKVYLWSLYLYEHFGGQPTIRDLVAQTTTGITSVRKTLVDMGYQTTFEQLMSDWYVANFLDDPNLDNGRYNYNGDQLPAFAAVTQSGDPVPPQNATVNHWAADYVRFTHASPQRINFSGDSSSVWTARVIKYEAGTPLSVEDIPLNKQDSGTFNLPGFGTNYDQVVLTIGNIADTGLKSYTYSTTDLSAVNGPMWVGGPTLDVIGPNPFSTEAALRLVLDRPAAVRATVVDARGAVVRPLVDEPLAAGAHALVWDGRDREGRSVANGVYFLRVNVGSTQEANRRVVRVK